MNPHYKDGCIGPDRHYPQGNIKGGSRKNVAPRAITEIDCKRFRKGTTDGT